MIPSRSRSQSRCGLALALLALLILALAASAPAAAQAAKAARPNIIVVLCDDMGFSDLGCYGGEIQTPNLDKLAAGGVRFTQFYNTARCCPTRACLLTGLYPHQAGIGHMTTQDNLEGYQGDLNNHCVTIAQVLKPSGYATYAVGKWHVTKGVTPDAPKNNWPLQRGFDRYYGTIVGAGDYYDPGALTRDNTMISPFTDPEYKPAQFYYTEAIADHAVRFITEHAQKQAETPFFMYVAFTAAHWPMHALERDIAKYKGKYDQGYTPIRQRRFERERELGLIDPKWELSPQFGDWEGVQDKAWEARCREVYAAMIDNMDQGMGKLTEALKKNGQFDNTLVLFMQDNGACAENTGRVGAGRAASQPASFPPIAADTVRLEVIPKQTRSGAPVRQGAGVMPGPQDTYIAYGEAWANVSNTPFRFYKHFVHEGGISTPLIAHWPAGIARHGALEKQPGHLIDIMATCVDLAGAAYPKELNGQPITPPEGRSLAPAFAGKPVEREAIYWEHEGNRAVRAGQWKLVAKAPAGPWELYDMDADRTEMHDLAAAQPERVKAMATQWEAWAKRAHALPWPYDPQYGEKSTGAKKAKGKKKAGAAGSRATHFELKAGDDLSGAAAPAVVGRAFKIAATVSDAKSGVILAHGGTSMGYALYVKAGVPVFALRAQGNLTEIAAKDKLPAGSATLVAELAPDGKMTLSVNDAPVAAGQAAQLITIQPVDGLQVGRDLKGTVGTYNEPNDFQGKIEKVTMDLK